MTIEKEFVDSLYRSLKDSYPESRDEVKKQFDLIMDGKKPTNILGMMIEDDVIKYKELIGGKK